MSEAGTSPSPYDKGKDAERLVRELLLYDGWGTVDVNEVQDSAPLVKWQSDSDRLPDIIGFHRQHGVAFFEVKEKKQGPEYIKNHKQYEHCIDKVSYRDYIDEQERTGFQVYICVYERPPEWRTLCYHRVSELESVETIKDRTEFDYGKPQVFFPRRQFNMISVSIDDPIEVNGTNLTRCSNPVLRMGQRKSQNENKSLDDYI